MSWKGTTLKATLIAVVLLQIFTKGFSQDPKQGNHYAVGLTYQSGYVFGTNTFVRGENKDKEPIEFYQQASIRFGRQTDGKADFEKKYNFPFYGIGFHIGDYNEPKEMGTPITVYGFCSFPLRRWNKLALIYDLEVGYSFNWEPYHNPDNPYNIAMGSKRQGYVGMGFFADINLSKRWNLNAGFHFAHYSNGAVKRPNLGINAIAPKVIFRYNLYNDEIDFSNRSVEPFKGNNEWNISIFAGSKEVITETSLDSVLRFTTEPFRTVGLTTTYHRKISFKSKFGVGTAISIDASNNHPDSAWTDNLQWSIFPSYELDIGKFTVLIQAGFYLARNQNYLFDSEDFYQRVGFKYHFHKNLYAGVNVRAFYFSTADYLEWNIGYRMKWSK